MRPPLLFALLCLLALSPASARAQSSEGSAHRVPFASSGNAIELAVANAAAGSAGPLTVALTAAPAWLAVARAAVALAGVPAGEAALAAFAFDVGEDAPVGEAAEVRFTIATAGGAVLAEKVVHLEVAAPERFALLGAFPKPVRSAARVAYELPASSEVRLEVYDVLGRRVAVVEAGEQAVGRREAVWAASGAASGVYLWRLVVEGASGQEAEQGRSTLVR
ncbi:MAG: hypothetical protein R3362_05365 [Rhodothermales bacterium]|nr:hypothetical protein [Rhodothermales bacterium]